MSEHEASGPTGRASWIGLGALALVLCCAGPALIAGGALGTIGAALGNPTVIAIGVLLIVTAIAITLRRRAQHVAAKPGDKHS